MKKRRTNIKDSIIKLFKEKHGNKYDYLLVDYKTMHDKVKIKCSIHGIFEQVPKAHLRGQGCKKCSIDNHIKQQTDTTEDFINKAKIIHGDKYSYLNTVYGKNAHEKIIITCRNHGDFKMTPNSHLSKKSNCPICMKRNTGWTKTSWKKSCEGKIAKLYVIECHNDKEKFYKIGITNRTLKERFYHHSIFPYNYTLKYLIESKDDPIYIYELERLLHELHKDVKYTPSKIFPGSTECFSQIKSILKTYADVH